MKKGISTIIYELELETKFFNHKIYRKSEYTLNVIVRT